MTEEAPLSGHHIFVVYGSLSMDAAALIGADLKKKNPSVQLYYLVLFDTDLEVLPPGAHVSMMAPAPGTYSEWSRPFAVAKWLSQVFQQHQEKWHQGSVTSYIPHPFELPGNVLAHLSPFNQNVQLLPDGLVNYCDFRLFPDGLDGSFRYAIRVLLRYLAALRFGFRYQPYFSGHITQFEQVDYKKEWTFDSKGYFSTRGHLADVPASKPQPKNTQMHAQEPCLLFLDQELDSLLQPALEETCRKSLQRYIRESEIPQLLYKAHPRGKNRFAEVASWNTRAEDVSGHDNAETMLLSRNVVEIVGFYSTPLVIDSADPPPRRTAFLPPASSPGVRRVRRVEAIRRALEHSGAQLPPFPKGRSTR